MSDPIAPLPCPFCGGANGTDEQGETYRWRLWACDCGAKGPDVRCNISGSGNGGVKEARQLAIAEWNKRHRGERMSDLVERLTEYAAEDDFKHADGTVHTTFRALAMREAAAEIERPLADAARWQSLLWHWEDDRDMGPGGRWWCSVTVRKGKPTISAAVDAAMKEAP